MSASDQPIVHTPGPWNLLCSEARGGPRCLVVCPKDNEIASINPFRESWNEDAELIAAAPMMKEILLDFCDSLGDNDCIPTHRQMLAKKAALALLSKVV